MYWFFGPDSRYVIIYIAFELNTKKPCMFINFAIRMSNHEKYKSMIAIQIGICQELSEFHCFGKTAIAIILADQKRGLIFVKRAI